MSGETKQTDSEKSVEATRDAEAQGSMYHLYCPKCGHTWYSPRWDNYCPQWGCTGRAKRM